jgi:hypothetical protein
LVAIARECDGLNERLDHFDQPDRLTSFWAYGPVLGGPQDWGEHEVLRSAVAFDVDPQRVPWYARPRDLEYAVDLLGWLRRPVAMMFRSAALPVWNHDIVRPLRLWRAESGVDEAAITALEAGDCEAAREAAPTPGELREQLERERLTSYLAMAETTKLYDDNRWSRGKLRPFAEPMWEAAAGYVDLTEALERL